MIPGAAVLREQKNVRVIEDVHLFTDRRQQERGDARRRIRVRNVDDLQAAELVEKVKGVPSDFPDVRLGHGTRRGSRAVVGGGSRGRGPLPPGPKNVCGALGWVALISAKLVCPLTTFVGGVDRSCLPREADPFLLRVADRSCFLGRGGH